MDFKTFFGSNSVVLPRGGFSEGKETFDAYLSRIFAEYYESLESVDDKDFNGVSLRIRSSLNIVKDLSQRIVDAVKHYLRGYPHEAYREIEAALESIPLESFISELSPFTYNGQLLSEPGAIDSSALHPPLYRIRVKPIPASGNILRRRDIFHVPFERRGYVSNQRYSIAGLPCLYLGSSLWICWEELGRPSLRSISVSRFRMAEPIKVLDFQLVPGLAWKLFDFVSKRVKLSGLQDALSGRYSEDFITAYVLCWPLIAASSILVQVREIPFYPQYIVPQLLLQWVTERRRVDGIRYFSTRTSPHAADIYAHSNCVFPAREIAASGTCAYLNKKFTLTAPISWEMLETINTQSIGHNPSNNQAVVQLSSDLHVAYNTTDFFTAEIKLEHIERELSKHLEDEALAL